MSDCWPAEKFINTTSMAPRFFKHKGNLHPIYKIIVLIKIPSLQQGVSFYPPFSFFVPFKRQETTKESVDKMVPSVSNVLLLFAVNFYT